jgi:hypothetical protein
VPENAAVVLVEMDKLRPRLADEGVEAVWEGFLQIATDHGPQEIRALRDKLIATCGRREEFQTRHDQLKGGVSLSQPFDDDGMAEYRLRLDPEGSQVLEAILILGPLSAPQPTPACPGLAAAQTSGHTGTPQLDKESVTTRSRSRPESVETGVGRDGSRSRQASVTGSHTVLSHISTNVPDQYT